MQKLYFSISEVCQMVDEEQHILRYWEKEFSQLKPRKNRGGNRIYSEKDLNLIKIIKSLLRKDKLSLKGAKDQLSKLLSSQKEDNLFSNVSLSKNIKDGRIKDFENKTKTVKKSGMFIIPNSEAKELLKVLRKVSDYLRII